MNGGKLPAEVLLNGAFWLYLLALVPTAVVTVLKGHLSLFFTGWLTFGLTWLVGGLMLAEPGSAWANWLYDERLLARATDPKRYPGPARTTALMAGGTLALLTAVGLLAARPAPLIGVHGEALQYSVGNGNLGSAVPPCRPAGSEIWSCQRYDDGFSGTVPYRVEVDGLGCWRGDRIGPAPGEGAAQRLSGCVTVWDEIRLLNAIL